MCVYVCVYDCVRYNTECLYNVCICVCDVCVMCVLCVLCVCCVCYVCYVCVMMKHELTETLVKKP